MMDLQQIWSNFLFSTLATVAIVAIPVSRALFLRRRERRLNTQLRQEQNRSRELAQSMQVVIAAIKKQEREQDEQIINELY